MAKYPFLSDEWLVEARRLHAEAELASEAATPTASVRVNLIVTEVPFQASPIDAHVDTSAGYFEIDTGHLDGPDVTVSLAYATARSIFVGGDVQAVMQAFLSGRIKVDGDLSKLLDPRSGMWPGAFAPGGFALGAPASASRGPGSGQAGPQPGVGSGQPAAGPGQPGAGPGQPAAGSGQADGTTGRGAGQQRLGFPGAGALELMSRLQEITE